MTGIVATILAFGVIATLMLVGIKMKLPPPDPDWREHLRPPPPPPSRLELIVFVWFRYGVWVAAIIAAAFDERGLALAFMVVFTVLILGRVVVRVRASHRVREQRMES
jgi:hypothetical protein